jgi:hypothetical protein
VVETGRRRRWTEDEKLRIGEPERAASGFRDGATVRHLAIAADDVASAVSGTAFARRGSRVRVRSGGGPPGGPDQRAAIVEPDGDRCGGTGTGSGSSVEAMIPVPSGVRVWIAAGHTDMRCGMNSLALRIQQALQTRSMPRRTPVVKTE